MRPFAVLLAAASLGPTLAWAQAAPEATAPATASPAARASGAVPAPAAMPSTVVVELYTSQGCSSCPPADALFAEIAKRDDVIALALHVDYWDYLGWKDDFARPRHTARQKAYAKAARSRTIFTPEVVVQGQDRLKGHDAAAIISEIAAYGQHRPEATLSVAREDDRVRIDVAPIGGSAGPADVHVVRYAPEEEVEIGAGENAGRTMTYRNVVTDWETVGQWDGKSAADFVFDDPDEGPLAVIIQTTRMGPILAAAKLP